jgi:hypothetical protein
VVGRIDATTAVFVDQPRTNLAGPTITATDLMAAIRDGSLDGQILAIDGTLQTVAWDCPLDAPEPCQRFYVDGLPGVAITWDGGSSAADASGAMDPYTGRLLVTPRHGRLQPGTGWLELLGVLHGDLARPVAFATLAGTFPAGSLRDTLRVDAVDGWLVVDGPIFCALIRPGGTPCPQQRSLLTPSAPTLSGELTAQDNLPAEPHRGAPGIGASPIREVGPFLVRQDLSTSGWVVVGRYDPNGVRVVTFP